jgi:hypothetical protein
VTNTITECRPLLGDKQRAPRTTISRASFVRAVTVEYVQSASSGMDCMDERRSESSISRSVTRIEHKAKSGIDSAAAAFNLK